MKLTAPAVMAQTEDEEASTVTVTARPEVAEAVGE